MTTKDMIARAQAWARRGTDEHERAHHMLDADADQYSDEAKDAEEDGDMFMAEEMRHDAALYCAARDALDAVPLLVGEIERLRADVAIERSLREHAEGEIRRVAAERDTRDTEVENLRAEVETARAEGQAGIDAMLKLLHNERAMQAAILAHLRDKAQRCADNPEDRDTAADMLREVADEIEAGDHLEEGK